VVYDEGLRSYKAIAFIESGKTIRYFKLGSTLLQKTVLIKQKTLRYLYRNLGGKNYG
jgi:hypothetical protein